MPLATLASAAAPSPVAGTAAEAPGRVWPSDAAPPYRSDLGGESETRGERVGVGGSIRALRAVGGGGAGADGTDNIAGEEGAAASTAGAGAGATVGVMGRACTAGAAGGGGGGGGGAAGAEGCTAAAGSGRATALWVARERGGVRPISGESNAGAVPLGGGGLARRVGVPLGARAALGRASATNGGAGAEVGELRSIRVATFPLPARCAASEASDTPLTGGGARGAVDAVAIVVVELAGGGGCSAWRLADEIPSSFNPVEGEKESFVGGGSTATLAGELIAGGAVTAVAGLAGEARRRRPYCAREAVVVRSAASLRSCIARSATIAASRVWRPWAPFVTSRAAAATSARRPSRGAREAPPDVGGWSRAVLSAEASAST